MRLILTILFFSIITCKGQVTGFHFSTFQSKIHPHFGVNIANDTFDIATHIHMAKSLGVSYFRYRLFCTQWDGVNNGFQRITDSGLSIVLNLNYTPIVGIVDYPQNLLGYGDTIRAMIGTYTPDLVVLENEQFNPNYYNFSVPQYMAMLSTASPIIHSYTASTGEQLKITDGGAPMIGYYILCYRWLQTNFNQVVADTFGNRCMQPFQINAAKNPCTNTNLETIAASCQQIIDAAKNGIIDYVNIHPYEVLNPNFTDAEDSTFTQVTRYTLRYTKLFIEHVSGKPCITNECGQRHNQQPLLVTRYLQEAYDLGLKYFIWYSGDSQDAAGAIGLFNQDGSIRPNGVAFQTFVFGLSHLGIP